MGAPPRAETVPEQLDRIGFITTLEELVREFERVVVKPPRLQGYGLEPGQVEVLDHLPLHIRVPALKLLLVPHRDRHGSVMSCVLPPGRGPEDSRQNRFFEPVEWGAGPQFYARMESLPSESGEEEVAAPSRLEHHYESPTGGAITLHRATAAPGPFPHAPSSVTHHLTYYYSSSKLLHILVTFSLPSSLEAHTAQGVGDVPQFGMQGSGLLSYFHMDSDEEDRRRHDFLCDPNRPVLGASPYNKITKTTALRACGLTPSHAVETLAHNVHGGKKGHAAFMAERAAAAKERAEQKRKRTAAHPSTSSVSRVKKWQTSRGSGSGNVIKGKQEA
ncbi:hypothetical protein JCM6882_002651 [Rhodosporidiobolus microsporus]